VIMKVQGKERSVVLGNGLSGLRAAAALAAAGHRVLLLGPVGAENPEIPEDLGFSFRAGPSGPLLEPVTGHLEPMDREFSRGFAFEGHLCALPPRLSELLDLLPPATAARAGTGWAAARLEARYGSLIGAWTEVRTWEDRAVRQFGRPIFEIFLDDYAARRWGPAGCVAAATGRRRAGRRGWERVAARQGPKQAQEGLVRFLEGHDAELRPDYRVRSLEVENGRVVAVRCDTPRGSRRLRVNEALWVTWPPSELLRWIGNALPAGVVQDGTQLQSKNAIQVLVRVSGEERLFFETHLVGRAPSFFRLVRPGMIPGCEGLSGHLIAHANVASDDPLWRAGTGEIAAALRAAIDAAGLGYLDPKDPRINHVAGHEPVWPPTWHPSWMRLLVALDALGIRTVGRAGAFAPLDEAGEWALLDALLTKPTLPVREVHRLFVDPPVRR
jgi:hypothetical protein